MSNHNNYRNYAAEAVRKENQAPVNPEALDETSIAPTEHEVQPEPEVFVVGSVTGCKKLNVRMAPTKKSDVLEVICAEDIVNIDERASKQNWYKVETASGAEGFCMKEFIRILK